MEVIILAGGLGTRLRAVVPDLPKPMAPIRGRPFLEHQMDFCIAQGASRFILSVGYKKELIESHFGERYKACEISYARESQPLGTGGGLLLALAQAKSETVLAVNGDTFFDVSFTALAERHQIAGASATLALRRIAHNDRYGEVLLDAQSIITQFTSEPSGELGLINGGVYLLNRAALLDLGWHPGDAVGLEQEMFPALLQRTRTMAGLISDGVFIDIGVPQDYERAANILPH